MFNAKHSQIVRFIVLSACIILYNISIQAMQSYKDKEEKKKYSCWDKLWSGTTKIVTIPKNTPFVRDSNWKNIVTYEKSKEVPNFTCKQGACSIFEYDDYEDIFYQQNDTYIRYKSDKKYIQAKTNREYYDNQDSIKIEYSFTINEPLYTKKINYPSKIFYPQGLDKDIQITVSNGEFTLERGVAMLAVCLGIAYKVNKLLD